ncbi:hypothetical protein [Fodinibius sp. Rm-B-1B1-1]|uniref:hypothetical protein n=1 Tax=Fodinibius alkaliphilus TaxID=3140241 RepID=UPI003159E034
MYLEMSRALLDIDVELEKDKNLNGIEDIPIPVKANLKFIQFSGSVIFSISYLEANINHSLSDIFKDRIKLQKINDQELRNKLAENFSNLKSKYDSEDSRNELFRYEKLTKKLNILYHTFDLTRLSESPDETDQRLWNDLNKLQDIRNELIHLKPDFVESEEFLDFFNTGEEEFKQRLRTPLFIVFKLHEDLPSIIPNLKENAIIEKLIFKYKGDAINEHLLTTGTPYTIQNVKRHGTRWIF